MTEIKFKSKLFDKYFRKYLNIENDNEPITEDMLQDIKYIGLRTTGSYCIAFGKGTLPEVFEFDECGDEWYYCCMKDTHKFKSYKDFLKINNNDEFITLEFIKEPEELDCNDKNMKEFNSSVKTFRADFKDFKDLERNEYGDTGFVSSDDFKYFKNAEVIRLMDCEVDIHSIGFINEMSNLKVLEIGQVSLKDHEGLDKLNTLKRLCIWQN